MQLIWASREIEAPSDEAWSVLTDVDLWPRWGPSISAADLDGDFVVGATGTVTTVVGLRLPFELTEVDVGRRWSWRIAGIPATAHRVEALTPDRCRIGFGVPWIAAPYAVICQLALRRIEHLVATEEPTQR